ncbi:putative proline-rich receptor-like protein kinase PERK13 [Iris pallida]|uniref:Proline-rich receptor-like protein kinase PERK13 n=1 Tax=Iris pallida TaxID=29817 RepID=A0AAX6DQ01_IRIPA|nr:putative proline-rich receptor-like protein kinase PERK13 [Iris pallida]
MAIRAGVRYADAMRSLVKGEDRDLAHLRSSACWRSCQPLPGSASGSAERAWNYGWCCVRERWEGIMVLISNRGGHVGKPQPFVSRKESSYAVSPQPSIR